VPEADKATWSTPRLNSAEGAFGTNWIVSYMGPRVGWDPSEKRRHSCPCQEWDGDCSFVRTVVSSDLIFLLQDSQKHQDWFTWLDYSCPKSGEWLETDGGSCASRYGTLFVCQNTTAWAQSSRILHIWIISLTLLLP